MFFVEIFSSPSKQHMWEGLELNNNSIYLRFWRLFRPACTSKLWITCSWVPFWWSDIFKCRIKGPRQILFGRTWISTKCCSSTHNNICSMDFILYVRCNSLLIDYCYVCLSETHCIGFRVLSSRATRMENKQLSRGMNQNNFSILQGIQTIELVRLGNWMHT